MIRGKNKMNKLKITAQQQSFNNNLSQFKIDEYLKLKEIFENE